MIIKNLKSEHGGVVLGTLLLVVIVGFTIFASVTLVTTQNRSNTAQIAERKAFYAAETGLEYALGVLEDSSEWQSGVSKDSVGDAEFSVSIDDNNTIPGLNDTILVTSTGFKSNVQRSIQAYLLLPSGGPDFDYVCFAGNDIDFSSGKAVVNGNLHANNSAIINANYTINGTVTQAPPMMDLPTVDWNFFKNKAIAAGQYVMDDKNFTKSESPYSGVWYITGKATISSNNIVVNGNIIAEDDVELLKNNEKITAPSNYPAILTKNDLIISGKNAEISGLIYCKDMETDNNGTVIMGAIVTTNVLKNTVNNLTIDFEPTYLTNVAGIVFNSSGNSLDKPLITRWSIIK